MYIIPKGFMSYQDQQKMRSDAVIKGKAMLARSLNRNTTTDLVDRDIDYVMDFVPAATRAGLGGWLSMPLAAVLTEYSLFANNAPAPLTPQVPNNTVWVFYGASILTLGNPVNMLFFYTGNANTRKGMFDLEKLYAMDEQMGYFTEFMVYEPQEIASVTVRARAATAAGCRVVLYGVVIEPTQINVN